MYSGDHLDIGICSACLERSVMSTENDPKRLHLPIDWRFRAEASARNLGFTAPLANLPAEHWQKVLIGVEMKMRLSGSLFPDDWQALLAKDVGRPND